MKTEEIKTIKIIYQEKQEIENLLQIRKQTLKKN